MTELVDNYRTWSLAMTKSVTSVAILYSSDYGFSDRLSQVRRRGGGLGTRCRR